MHESSDLLLENLIRCKQRLLQEWRRNSIAELNLNSLSLLPLRQIAMQMSHSNHSDNRNQEIDLVQAQKFHYHKQLACLNFYEY